MCYYNGVKVTKSEFIRLKSIEKAIAKYDFLDKPLHIGFKYEGTPVLKKIDGQEDFEIVQQEWGFLPDPEKWPYIKTRAQAEKIRKGYVDEKGKFVQYTFLNAVSEELLFKNKIYRDAALNRRCLALSTGFFEWRHLFPANKRTGLPVKTAVKYPYNIGLKDKEYFYIAGIWNPWTDQESGEHVETLAFVTTEANSTMAQVHNSKKRMPTILPEELAWEWLFGDLDENRIAEIAKYQLPASQMEACSIDKGFLTSDDPRVPAAYAELPALELVA
jgi:putative SOS response-associated peptidase YedK